METIRIYTEKDLVAFGNYLLSEERKNNLAHESNYSAVTDADIANYNYQLKEKETEIFHKSIELMKAHSTETDPEKKIEIMKQIESLTQEMNPCGLRIAPSELS